ncbi:protein of unknown function [Burkholderia multivorans]
METKHLMKIVKSGLSCYGVGDKINSNAIFVR